MGGIVYNGNRIKGKEGQKRKTHLKKSTMFLYVYIRLVFRYGSLQYAYDYQQAGYIHIETWYFFSDAFFAFVCCGAEMWVDRVEDDYHMHMSIITSTFTSTSTPQMNIIL
jgi:hypothetical protein